MADFHISVKKPVADIVSSDNVDIVWVPEPIEEVQAREFDRRVNRAVKENLERLLKQKLEELQQKIQQEKNAEYHRGYEEGVKTGRADEEEKLRQLRNNLSYTIQETIAFKDKMLKEAEAAVVKMSFVFAKQIIGEAVRIQPEIIENQVKKALEFVIDESKLIFRVNPEDIAQFEEKERFIPESVLKKVEVIPDETIGRGGCILETNAGVIDATIESQASELAKALHSGMEHSENRSPSTRGGKGSVNV